MTCHSLGEFVPGMYAWGSWWAHSDCFGLIYHPSVEQRYVYVCTYIHTYASYFLGIPHHPANGNPSSSPSVSPRVSNSVDVNQGWISMVILLTRYTSIHRSWNRDHGHLGSSWVALVGDQPRARERDWDSWSRYIYWYTWNFYQPTPNQLPFPSPPP